MSLKKEKKQFIFRHQSLSGLFIFHFFLIAAFLFVLTPRGVNAYHSVTSYEKLYNDTLTSDNWNDLFDDFVNTWLPVSLNGPVGIATSAPASGLEVNGLIKATNIFSTGSVGIGTTDPQAKLEVVPTSGYSILAGELKIGNVALPTADADAATMGWVNSALASATSSITLWGGSTGGNIWNLNSGNVGIGTTAPLSPLHIANGMESFIRTGHATNNETKQGGLVSTQYISDAEPEGFATLFAYGPSGGNYVYFGGGYSNYNAATQIRFYTAPDVTTRTGTLRMSIGSSGNFDFNSGQVYFQQSTGNVGIGTTSPTYPIHFHTTSSGSRFMQFSNFTTGTTATDGFTIGIDSDENGRIQLRENTDIQIFTNSTEVMRIKNSGNVGIGTTGPGAKLEIDGGNLILTTTATNRLILPSNNYQTTPTLAFGDGDSGIYESGDDTIDITIAGSSKYRFNATYMGSSMSTGARLLRANATATAPGLVFSSGDTDTGVGYAAADIVSLIAGGTNGLNVISSGNVGIGTTAPQAKLEVVPTSGYSILAGELKIGNVALPTADADAATKGYVDSYVASATSTITTIAKFVGLTSGTYSGNNNGNNGYAYAHAQCAAAFPDSHVCASYEILNTIATGSTMLDQDGWIFNGPPGYTALANDCDARTKGTSAAWGTYWQKPGTGYPEGRGLLMLCNNVLRLACCK